jgi:ABC-type transporter Mla subunit MlaD
MIRDFFLLPYRIYDEIKKLQAQLTTQSQLLEALMLDLNTLTTAVAENNDVVESAVVLINTLVEELRAAAGNQAAIDAIVTQLDAQTDVLAAAVAANTVADPAPVEEPPVE